MAEILAQAFEIGRKNTAGLTALNAFVNASRIAGNTFIVFADSFSRYDLNYEVLVMAQNVKHAAGLVGTGAGRAGTTVEIAQNPNGLTALATFMNTQFAGQAAPAIPTLALSAGGTLTNPSTLFVRVTYVFPAGETASSPEATISVATGSQKLTVTPPVSTAAAAAAAGATGYNVYIGTVTGAANCKLQNGGTPVALAAAFNLTANPNGATAASPGTTNGTSLGLIQDIRMVKRFDEVFIQLTMSN